jgi:hypothetical protein
VHKKGTNQFTVQLKMTRRARRSLYVCVVVGGEACPPLFCRLLLLLLLQIRTQLHLGCCLAAATAAASATFMHLCTNSATPYPSRQHMRSCNDENGNCANRRSRLTTAVAGHKREDGLRHPQDGRAFPKRHIACSHAQTKPLLDACQVPPLSCGY